MFFPREGLGAIKPVILADFAAVCQLYRMDNFWRGLASRGKRSILAELEYLT
jgi:hypothetical protein